MKSIHHESWESCINELSPEVRAAWAGTRHISTLTRLTEDRWAFRAVSGQGPWLVLELHEAAEILLSMRCPTPFAYPVARPRPASTPSITAADADQLLSDLGF
jgi:hypothetical protein